ncbi:MAG TPA: twin-arginine translocase subunit TatC [Rhizobiaceae bacterium]|nr:twin-arginine translocase subunit TatC [Rhizobiaceae bacterium]
MVIVALALLGPAKLPAGIEQLWLMLTNFRRSQADQDPLTLEQARRIWERSENPLYDVVQILYGTVEHLVELRRRIFFVLGALIVGAVVAGIFADRILGFLTLPAGGVPLVVLRPTDMIWTYFEVIFSAAAIVALPVLLFQILLFVRPALETPTEITLYRTVGIVGMPMVALFFIGGLAFSYYILLPFGLKYLQGFGSELAQANWNIREYFSFILAVMLWIGVAFETPVIMAALARLGIVSPHTMAKQWRYAFVGIAFVAAAITPTVDPVNMALVMGPLLALYFLGVLMARAVYRPRLNPE